MKARAKRFLLSRWTEDYLLSSLVLKRKTEQKVAIYYKATKIVHKVMLEIGVLLLQHSKNSPWKN